MGVFACLRTWFGMETRDAFPSLSESDARARFVSVPFFASGRGTLFVLCAPPRRACCMAVWDTWSPPLPLLLSEPWVWCRPAACLSSSLGGSARVLGRTIVSLHELGESASCDLCLYT